MQIQSNQLTGSLQGLMQQNKQGNEALTQKQTQSLEEILASLDLENMTDEDYAALREAMQDANIPKSKDTKEFLEDAGVNMEAMKQSSPLNDIFEEAGSLFADLLEKAQPALSSDQKFNIEEILKDFNLDSMTKEDHQGLKSALEAAGIPQNQETLEILKESGLETMQGVNGLMPPPPMMAQSSSESQSFLGDILKQVQSGTISEDAMRKEVEQFSRKSTGAFLNISV